MPLTATIEEIKAYQEQVEKDKITPDGLPPCPRCELESFLFKIHTYRERRFLLIVKMLVKSIFCTLVRFRCVRCGKTFTHYPSFAIPFKHYTRQTIESFSNNYVEYDQKTYETATMTDDGIPVYPDSKRTLAASTIYQWISALARLITSCQDIFSKSPHKSHGTIYNSPDIAIPKQKYRTPERKAHLLRCRYYFRLNSV